MNEKTLSLSDFILLIASQIKIIVVVPIMFSFIALIWVLFIANPEYVSEAKIMSSSNNNNQAQASGIAAQFGINLPVNNPDAQWVYPEIVKSRTLARSMLKRKFDSSIHGKDKLLLQILNHGDDHPESDQNVMMKTGIDNFLNMISIEEINSFYNLAVRGPEPLLVRDIAIALIEELDSYQRQYNKKKNNETRLFIENRIEQTKIELMEVEEKLRNFTERNRRIENSPALLLEQQRLGREVAVLTGVFTTLKQQLETTKIEQVKDFDYVIVLDPPEAPLYPAKPNKKLIIIFAFVSGFGLSFFIALIFESLSKMEEKELNKFVNAKRLLYKSLFGLFFKTN